MQPNVDLAPDYYLTNFKILLEFVVDKYQAILSREEQEFFRRFIQLEEDAQKLLTRCYMRKGTLFRLDKMKYSEIRDLHRALALLYEAKLVSPYEWQNENLAISLFSKSELIALFEKPEWKSLRRAELEDCIQELLLTQPLPEKLSRQVIFRVSQEHFDTFRLLFFGNLRQDLTEFVLQDLGLIKYENYNLSRQHLPIQYREQINALIRCHQINEMHQSKKDWTPEQLGAMLESIPVEVSGQWVERRCESLINRLARELERCQCLDSAVDWYRKSSRPPATERRIRCLEKLGRYDEAWQELERLKNQSLPQQERVFLRVFEPKLAKRLGRDTKRSSGLQPLRLPPEERIQLQRKSKAVEEDVIEYLCERELSDAYWCENALWNMLFALSYWDLIFADVEGAFYNPFQMRPADMYEADFLLKREAQYQALQPVLNNDTLFKKRIMENYQRHFGKACVFTNWSAVDRQLLQKTLERVPLSHIRLCINRILDDPKEHRSGLPDLIVFHGQQDYQLVEVKGPGDRLQNNQKMWMDFFAEHKIPHRLIRVDYESEQSLVVSSETGDLATAAPLQEVQSE